MKKFQELDTETTLTYAMQCLENNPDGIFWSNGDGAITYANSTACRNLGYTKEEIIGMNILDIDANLSYENFNKLNKFMAAPKGEIGRLQSLHKHKNGHLIPVDISMGILESTELSFRFSFVRDMTEHIMAEQELKDAYKVLQEKNNELNRLYIDLKTREEQLEFLAYHDILTGLSNRNLLLETINQNIDTPEAKTKKFALLFIDLDNFKNINDGLGHSIGDMVLVEASKRLRDTIKEADCVYRFGGDEFIILIQDIGTKEDLQDSVLTIKNCLMDPFCFETTSIYLTCSIGVTIFPDDADSSEGLLMFADAAMYRAKLDGKNQVHFVSNEMKQDVLSKIDFQNKLWSALELNEMYLEYQPQYSVRTGSCRGVEALIRWESPSLGVIDPNKLIPVAEEMGLIIPIGKWVLLQACKTVHLWEKEYGYNGIVSVNISGIQLKSAAFVNDVREALEISGIDPKRLELEITESTFIASFESTVSKLHELKKLGVRICLDDFGTGYSSLGYLMQLPVDTLKIDKTFIRQKNISSKQKHIVRSIIALVNSLGMETVVEGIETKEQFEFLKTTKSDYLQGYLFSRPLKENEVTLLFLEKESAVL